MPTTPRERFDDNFSEITINQVILSKNGDYECTLEDVWSFIETLLEEARQDMKEKCLKCILPYQPGTTEYSSGWNDLKEEITKSIQSL